MGVRGIAERVRSLPGRRPVLSSSRRALLSACGVLLALPMLAPRATAGDSPFQAPAEARVDFESFVEFVRGEAEKSEEADAGPSCGAQDAYVASVARQKQLEAQILELRKRAQIADQEGGPKLLNGSGYNYRPTVIGNH